VTLLATRPEPIDIEPTATAVVIVDMQNAFASVGGMFDIAGHDVSGAAAAIEATRSVAEAARAAGSPVVYLQMGYSSDLSTGGGPDSPNYQKELALVVMRERPELSGTLLVEGTWDWQIVEELAPEPGDVVVAKTRYDGFVGTGLADMLRGRGLRNLLFCGIATNVCVESTARSAFFNEFWPVLVTDAMNHAGPDFMRAATEWSFEHVFGWLCTAPSAADFFA
jgi:ureidoacrylate peracid hydrolase